MAGKERVGSWRALQAELEVTYEERHQRDQGTQVQNRGRKRRALTIVL